MGAEAKRLRIRDDCGGGVVSAVWVVEQGEYSDYRVVGVFSSKEAAERACAFMTSDYSKPEVAEWALDPGASELNQGMAIWSVHMTREGRTERYQMVEAPFSLESYFRIWRRSAHSDLPDVIAAQVWATDGTHAIKIVNEKRAEWIALGKWDEQP